MSGDVFTEPLSTEDAERVYEQWPALRRGVCPTCEGEGVYRWRGLDHECDCPRQIQLAKHYGAAGIGREYQCMDWADWQGSQAVFTQIHDYLLDYKAYVKRGVGLVLWGAVGTGKTFLLYMIAKELVRRRVQTYCTLSSGMTEAFTASWSSPEEKRHFVRKFMYSDALFIDDLGKEFLSKNRLSQTTFDMILRIRDQNSRATFINTNLHGKQLSYGYGASVLSMLEGRNITIEVVGDDYRVPMYDLRRREIRIGEVRPIV